MKHLILALALILGMVGLAHAATVELAWDAVPDPACVGYKVYWGSVSRTYTGNIDVGNVTTWQQVNVPVGTRYYAVTAYDATKTESTYSNEVFATIKLAPPANARVVQITVSASSQRPITVK